MPLAMLGVFITFLFSLCMVGFGRLLFGKWLRGLDAAAQLGIGGMLGLATVGLITLPIGLMPNGLVWGRVLVWLLAAAGIGGLLRPPIWKASILPKPKNLDWLFVGAIIVASGLALLAVLTPSNTLDWDTIAYHLAVPKLWLQAGHIYPIPYIHHSNFPLSIDNLYIWGLSWGDQYGAKAFELAFYVLGLFAVFGLTRARYGSKAAAWAALTFGTVPVALWEAGTGYIDTAHGLFTAIAAILTVQMLEEKWGGGRSATSSEATDDSSPATREASLQTVWPIAALCYGFSAGSKYTGLQAFLVSGIVFGAYILFRKKGVGAGRLAATFAVGLAVCAAWYVKNEIWVGNPVYPFFYEQLGGKNWDEYNASIYKNQQQTFGVPRTGVAAGMAAFPDAVLGLAFQPSRYTDPSPSLVVTPKGPAGADGFPWQATGAAIIIAGVVWMLSGKIKRFEGLLLAWVGLSLLMWFVLSQQSRYALDFAPIFAMLLGAGVVRLRAGLVLAAASAVQAAFTLYLLYTTQYKIDAPYVFGKESGDYYFAETLPVHHAFEWLNQNAKGGRVALYDEVFGFYLDVPYFWANPGHTTLIGYDKLQTGEDYVARMKQMGFTYLYVSLAYSPHKENVNFRNAIGLDFKMIPFSQDRKQELMSDPGQKYKWLIADATEKGLLEPVQDYGWNGFILRVK